MLGKGGGVGIIMAKAKIIITKPNPTASMALITSLMATRSAEELFTTSSIAFVAIEVLLLLYFEFSLSFKGTNNNLFFTYLRYFPFYLK